jgi:hypothetical protein
MVGKVASGLSVTVRITHPGLHMEKVNRREPSATGPQDSRDSGDRGVTGQIHISMSPFQVCLLSPPDCL